MSEAAEYDRPERIEITIYDLATGAAIYTTKVDAGREADCCEPGQGWVRGAAERVRPSSGRKCGLMTMKPNVSVNRVSNIPVGTMALIGLSKFAVEDGAIEFSLPYAQSVRVRLVNPLYRPLPPFEVPCEADG